MNFYTFFNFRMNIKPFDTIESLREGIKIKCTVAVLVLTVVFTGFHISAVIIIYLYITMTQKFFANFFLTLILTFELKILE